MIYPVTHESAWQARLSHLPLWNPPTGRIVFVSPHPDDETLAAGGFLAMQRSKGVEITVVSVTDGENAYGPCDCLGAIRVQEQISALARLGIPSDKIVRLSLVDSGVKETKRCCLSLCYLWSTGIPISSLLGAVISTQITKLVEESRKSSPSVQEPNLPRISFGPGIALTYRS